MRDWTDCHRENVIILLTVNVILFPLFSCLKRQITHCFINTEWHSKSVLCSTSPSYSMCLQCCICLNGVTSSRVQRMRCSISSVCFCIMNIFTYAILFSFYKKWEWTQWGGKEHIKVFCLNFCFSYFFYLFLFNQIFMLKNNVMRSLEWKCLLKCVWGSFSHQGYSCTFIGSRSLEWYIWL